jgi:RNA binding exosome subunit
MSQPVRASRVCVDRIEARAYCRATEVPERVKMALLNLFPESILNQVVVIEEMTEGHLQSPILVITASVGQSSLAEATLRLILSSLTAAELQYIINTLDRRLDAGCTLFLRVDKQAAYLGHIEMAQNPDVISIQIHIRKFPKCGPTDAKEIIQSFAVTTGEPLA